MKFTACCSFCLLCLTLPPRSVPAPQTKAAQVTSGQDAFEKASLSVWKWLQNVDGGLDKFVAKENRSQLKTRLHNLNEALYRVETAKLALIFDLKNSTGSEDEIKRMDDIVYDLTNQVDNLRSSVHQVSILLREKAAEGGAECEDLLSSATGARKEWLFELAHNPQLLKDPATKERLISKGEAAVTSLRNASLELGKLTEKLDKP